MTHNLIPLSSQHRRSAVELQAALLKFEAAATTGVEKVHAAGLDRERRIFEKLEQQSSASTRAAAGAGGEVLPNGEEAGDPTLVLMQEYVQLAALALEGKVRARPMLAVAESRWRSSLLGALDTRAR